MVKLFHYQLEGQWGLESDLTSGVKLYHHWVAVGSSSGLEGPFLHWIISRATYDSFYGRQP